MTLRSMRRSLVLDCGEFILYQQPAALFKGNDIHSVLNSLDVLFGIVPWDKTNTYFYLINMGPIPLLNARAAIKGFHI